MEGCFIEWTFNELFKRSRLGDVVLFLVSAQETKAPVSPGAGLSLVVRDASFHLVAVGPWGSGPSGHPALEELAGQPAANT